MLGSGWDLVLRVLIRGLDVVVVEDDAALALVIGTSH